MFLKYTGILHTLQKPPKFVQIGIFGFKIYYLATLVVTAQISFLLSTTARYRGLKKDDLFFFFEKKLRKRFEKYFFSLVEQKNSHRVLNLSVKNLFFFNEKLVKGIGRSFFKFRDQFRLNSFFSGKKNLTVNVNCSEARVNEKSECSGELAIRFALARDLDTLLELIN
jgi:hypothetical protein